MPKIKSITFNDWVHNNFYNNQDNFEDKIYTEVRRVLGEDTLAKYSVCAVDYSKIEDNDK